MRFLTLRSALLLSIFVPLLAFSEMDQPSQSNLAPGLKGRQFFDPQNKITIKGIINDVVKVKHPDGKTYGIHLRVKSDNQEYSIHLGPKSFLDDLGLKLDRGEKIEVEGILVEFQGAKAIIATAIKENGKSYILRDERGAPEWRGPGNPNR